MSDPDLMITDYYSVSGSLHFCSPQYVGEWVISGNFCVQVAQRPSWLHRYMTRLLLGWEWRDAA